MLIGVSNIGQWVLPSANCQSLKLILKVLLMKYWMNQIQTKKNLEINQLLNSLNFNLMKRMTSLKRVR